MTTDRTAYRVIFQTRAEIVVTLIADDEDDAADRAWQAAEEYLNTLTTQSHHDAQVYAAVSVDGIGADTVVEVSA